MWWASAQGGDNPSAEGTPAGSASPGEQGSASPSRADQVLSLDGTGGAKCLVPTAALLGRADVAFRGTVTAVEHGDGQDVVTLDVDEAYAGAPASPVTITSPDLGAALDGSLTFEQGGSYLVSADGGQVRVCGFSGVDSPGLRAMYDEAFGK